MNVSSLVFVILFCVSVIPTAYATIQFYIVDIMKGKYTIIIAQAREVRENTISILYNA